MKVKVILTNWKRKNNLIQIIESIKSQSHVCDVVVIDNSSNDPIHSLQVENVKTINKSNELKCWERWVEASVSTNEYICIMDDDLIFTDYNVIDDCVKYMDSNKDIDCIGIEGVKLNRLTGYWGSEHFICKLNKDTDLPIVKGRFMFIRNKSLIRELMTPDHTCDDIMISSILNRKVLPGILYNRFKDLPTGNESLSLKSYQQAKRNYAAKTYFK